MPAKENKITGIVVPAKWDDAGNVTGTAIQSFDENEYVIEHDCSGAMLKELIHKSVVVSGKIRERLDGKKLIRVLSVKLIPNSCGNHQSKGRGYDEKSGR